MLMQYELPITSSFAAVQLALVYYGDCVCRLSYRQTVSDCCVWQWL